MKNFENRIKEELSNARSMEGLDSELLWNAISASAFDNKKKKRRLGVLWFIFSMCAVLSWIVFCFIVQPKKNGLSVAENNVPETKRQLESRAEITEKSELGQDHSMEVTPFSTNDSDNNVKLYTNGFIGDKFNNGLNQRAAPQSKELNSAQWMGSMMTTLQDSVERISDYSDTEKISMLTSCPPNSLVIGPISLPRFEVSLPPQDFQKGARSLHCYGGPLWANQTFTAGDRLLVDDLNDDLSSEWGFVAGGMVEIKRGQNWFIQTGLEYSNWKDRFDKVMFSDTLLIVNQQEVIGKNIRTIRHHNSLSVLSTPVQFGMYKDFGRLRLGLQFGVSYSLILQQEGRILKDNVTVFNYSQDQKRFSNFFSLRITPSMGYMLNESLLLNFSCLTAMQKHHQMAFNGVKSKSFWIAPTMGFVYNY